MNYIWELTLMADREGISEELFRYIHASQASPYQELAIDILNLHSLGEVYSETNDAAFPVEVNALYRFAREFSKIFDLNVTELEQSREIFFDVCMHYMTRIDLLSGMSKYEYYLKFLEEDIEEARFGDKISERFNYFSLKEKDVILSSLFDLYRTGHYLEEFKHAVAAIYRGAIIYESTDSANELLVYLGKQETKQEQNRISLLIDLFLPLQESVHIFYDRHFGIIDVDETMKLDEMVLF